MAVVPLQGRWRQASGRGDMEPPGDGKQLLPRLCIIDAQADFRVRRGQRLPQRDGATQVFPLRCRMAPSALTERVTSSVPFAQTQRRSSARSQHSGISSASEGSSRPSGRQAPTPFHSFPAPKGCSPQRQSRSPGWSDPSCFPCMPAGPDQRRQSRPEF